MSWFWFWRNDSPPASSDAVVCNTTDQLLKDLTAGLAANGGCTKTEVVRTRCETKRVKKLVGKIVRKCEITKEIRFSCPGELGLSGSCLAHCAIPSYSLCGSSPGAGCEQPCGE